MSFNLEKEIKNYTDMTKQNEITTSKLYLFFRTFTADGLKVIDKSNKILEEFLNELHKESSSTTNNVAFIGFYNDIHRFLNQLKIIYSSMDQNISNKIEHLIKRMQNNHNVALNNLSNLSLSMSDSKLKIEKYKNNYFSAYKNLIEQEKKIIQLKENKNFKEEDFSRSNDLLSKYTSNMENQEGIYKMEINKLNKTIESSEELYSKIIKIFKDEYNNKLNVILDSFNEFKKGIKNIIDINTDIIPKIDKAYKSIDVERDIKIFSEKNIVC